MRKIIFANKEFYHVYNRGVDQRDIFLDNFDSSRFFQSMSEFNIINPIGSIYENSFNKKLGSLASKSGRLVNFVAYCLNPNHYHFILEQVYEKGIEKFMHRVGTGYTKYFNNKHKRCGSLFQGQFKSSHINSNEYLLYLSAYVNLNHSVHQLGSLSSKLKDSWEEYNNISQKKQKFCETDIILNQFKNPKEYKDFSKAALKNILRRKQQEKEIAELLME